MSAPDHRSTPAVSSFQTPKPPAPFTTPLSAAEMANKQAVVHDYRRDVRDRPAAGPRAEPRWLFHQAGERRAPTTARYSTASSASASFRAAIRCRRIRRKSKLYGTGGLGVLKAEPGGEKPTRGAVAAVLQPGKPDSAGSQFFICVTDQLALAGQVHDLRPRLRRPRRRPEDLRGARR